MNAAAYQKSPTSELVEPDVYDDGCLRLEDRGYFLAVQGKPISLSRTEFLILSRLIRNINSIVTFKDLWEFAWGREKPVKQKSIVVFVSRLRRKLGPLGLRLDSVVNVGYILSHWSCCSPEQSGRDT